MIYGLILKDSDFKRGKCIGGCCKYSYIRYMVEYMWIKYHILYIALFCSIPYMV